MEQNHIGFAGLTIKTIVVHTVTYFAMGFAASSLLSYSSRFASAEMACWMRPTSDPIVMAGPLFQPIRGLVFAAVIYPLREILLGKKNGWLILWWTLVGLGILSTFGPPPGSIEGLIYTRIPVLNQLTGWLEVVPQAFLLSIILYYWANHPEKRWLDWVLGAAFVIAMLLPVLGLLVR